MLSKLQVVLNIMFEGVKTVLGEGNRYTPDEQVEEVGPPSKYHKFLNYDQILFNHNIYEKRKRNEGLVK